MMANPDGFATLDEAAAAIAEYNPHRPPPSSSAGLTKVLRQGEDGRWRWHWDPKFIAERAALMLSDPEAWEAERQVRADRLHGSAGALQAPLLLIRGLLSDLVSDEAVAALRAAAPRPSTSTCAVRATWWPATTTTRSRSPWRASSTATSPAASERSRGDPLFAAYADIQLRTIAATSAGSVR